MHMILAFLLSLLSLFHTPTYTEVIDKAQASVVRVTGTLDDIEYFCTGEVIAPHRVLTAAHCVGDNMAADGIPVGTGILAYSKYFDLALLDVKTEKPALALRRLPIARFEDLSAIGYGWGLSHMFALKVNPFLTNMKMPDENPSAPEMLAQWGYVGGMSGGPVIDSRGLMVGIVQRTGDGVGLGVDVLQIEAFIAGA